MNKEFVNNYQLPSVSVRKRRVRNAKYNEAFQSLTTGIPKYKEIELEWLLSLLKTFLRRINKICDNTVLLFLKNGNSYDSEEKIITFFLEAIEAECLEIQTTLNDLPFDRVNQAYQIWTGKNPISEEIPV